MKFKYPRLAAIHAIKTQGYLCNPLPNTMSLTILNKVRRMQLTVAAMDRTITPQARVLKYSDPKYHRTDYHLISHFLPIN